MSAQKVEERTWDNGNPKSRESLDKKGFKTGECTYWYENGQMKLREYYEKGRRSGKCEGWFEDGTPQFVRTYVVEQRNNGSLAGTEPVAVKDGHWVEYHENGQKRKEEVFQRGVLQGVVRSWHENGALDEEKTMADKFENGPYQKYHENGQLQTKGAYEKGEKSGEWETWYSNGQMAYRDVYDSDKRRDGPWRGAHPDGSDSLRGAYVRSRKEGLWEAFHPNGRMKSRTQYRWGVPYGPYVEYYSNGNKRVEGGYKTLQQEFLETIFPTDLQRGERVGEWKEWYENGQLMSLATYEDEVDPLVEVLSLHITGIFGDNDIGRRKGPYAEWYENGNKKFETNYKVISISVFNFSGKAKWDEMMDGLTREWHENGQPMSEGAYVDGLRDGLWREWYPSGALRMQAVFDRAKVSGAITEFYEDGREMSRGFYEVAGRKKKRTGHWTTWYPGGERESEGEYIDNKRQGRWQQWFPNGQLKEDAFFVDGANQGGFREYDESGALRTEGQFKGERRHQGLQHGEWKFYDEQGVLLRTEHWVNGRKK